MSLAVISEFRSCWLFWALLAFAFFRPGRIFSQFNINVPPDDPAYEHVEVLRAWGLVHSDIWGTKPFGRVEFARLYLEAQSQLEGNPQAQLSALVDGALKYLAGRFSAEVQAQRGARQTPFLALHPMDLIDLSYVNFKGRNRALPDTSIDAVIQPFTAYREGRRFLEGQNAAIESSHWLALANFGALYYQGRLVFLAPRQSAATGDDVDYETLRFYVQLTRWNLDLLVGKESQVWGFGTRGKLLLSRNAKPVGSFKTLPMIKLSNRRPIRLPWILNGLGPMRFTLFVSRLEKNRRDFARPYFVGLRLNFRPSKNTEFSFSHTFILGGENFPVSFSFFDALAEFFFIRTKENFLFNIGTGKRKIENNIANHLVGFDVLFRIPGLRFTEIYQEFYFDDVTMNLFTNLNRNLGYHGGLFVPRFTRDGRLSLRLEYTRTPTIFYKGSSVFTSGYTFSRHILGSDLGPLGQELFTEVKFKPAANTSWAAVVDFQKRGVDRDTGPEFLTRPDEDRIEIGGVYTKQFNAFFALSLDVRYQRILSFDNVRGADHNAYFSGISIQLSDFFNKAVIR